MGAIFLFLKLISPREWAGLAIIAALAAGGVYIYRSGEAHVKAADERAKQAQIIHNREVEDRAQKIATAQVSALRAELARAPAPDAPHLVCARAKPASGVRHDGGAGPAPVGNPVVASEGSGDHEGDGATVDIGPALDKNNEDADARLKAAQDYIRGCIAIGACKSPAPK